VDVGEEAGEMRVGVEEEVGVEEKRGGGTWKPQVQKK